MDAEDDRLNGKRRPAVPDDAVQASEIDALLGAARSYFYKEFGNPSRSGCPPASYFLSALRENKLPDEELRRHLFGCSECFREYSEAVEKRRNFTATESASPQWRKVLGWLLPEPAHAYAALASLVVIAAAVFFVLHWRGERSSENASFNDSAGSARPASLSSQSPVPSVSQNSSAVANTSPQVTAPIANSSAPLRRTHGSPAKLITVLIDLAGYSSLRADGPASGAPRATKLAPAVNRLWILLPQGSPAGVYRVTAVDAFDRPLIHERSARSAGKAIVVNVDTSKLSGRRCRLRISRDGEAPDYYPVNVSVR